MSNTAFPAAMMPLLPFFQSVEVLGEISEKTDGEGVQKVHDGLPQWTVAVIVPKGRLAVEQRVTVLAYAKPDFHDGDRVIFTDLQVGAYSGASGAGLYFWATDIRAAKGAE